MERRLIKRLKQLGIDTSLKGFASVKLLFMADDTLCLSNVESITLFTSEDGHDSLTFFTELKEALAYGPFRAIQYDFERQRWLLIREDDTTLNTEVHII